MTTPISRTPDASYGIGTTACVIALLGLIIPTPSFVELYHIPAGTATRPMGPAAAALACGGVPFVVAPLAILAFQSRGRSRWLGVFAAVTSLLPFPVYFFLFKWIVDTHNLTLKP